MEGETHFTADPANDLDEALAAAPADAEDSNYVAVAMGSEIVTNLISAELSEFQPQSDFQYVVVLMRLLRITRNCFRVRGVRQDRVEKPV